MKRSNCRYFSFFSSRRRHTRWNCDWSSDVCSSDLLLTRYLAGGRVGWSYHRFEHLLEVARLEVELAIRHRYRENEILAVVVAALLHDDFDPNHPNAPPGVEETSGRPPGPPVLDHPLDAKATTRHH